MDILSFIGTAFLKVNAFASGGNFLSDTGTKILLSIFWFFVVSVSFTLIYIVFLVASSESFRLVAKRVLISLVLLVVLNFAFINLSDFYFRKLEPGIRNAYAQNLADAAESRHKWQSEPTFDHFICWGTYRYPEHDTLKTQYEHGFDCPRWGAYLNVFCLDHMSGHGTVIVHDQCGRVTDQWIGKSWGGLVGRSHGMYRFLF